VGGAREHLRHRSLEGARDTAQGLYANAAQLADGHLRLDGGTTCRDPQGGAARAPTHPPILVSRRRARPAAGSNGASPSHEEISDVLPLPRLLDEPINVLRLFGSLKHHRGRPSSASQSAISRRRVAS
jgi:hypothetical protein